MIKKEELINQIKLHNSEIAHLANDLNIYAAELCNARKDLDTALFRVENAEKSLEVIQTSIFKQLGDETDLFNLSRKKKNASKKTSRQRF